MNILLTGAAGFIGSHVVDRLLAAGHEVWAVDDLSTGRSDNLPDHPGLHRLIGSLFDCPIEHLTSRIDGLIHLAARPSVPYSWTRIREAHECNLTATLHIIEWLRALEIPRVVFASSAAVYGAAGSLTDGEPVPLSPYGLQKLASERYLNQFAPLIGYSAVNLRLFNVYGPRQLAQSDYAGVITRFAAARRAGERLTIHGDGSQSRDFVYVTDVARAFEAALTADLAAGEQHTCDIGRGVPVSVSELAGVIRRLLPGPAHEPLHQPARTGDIRHSRADPTAACDLLGFQPRIAIAEGLTRYLASLNPEP